jgi:SNF family Na+-dependent transporter
MLRVLRFASASTRIALLTFFVAALSNNALSTKTPAVAIVLVLVLAFSNRAPVKPGPERRG